MSAGQYGHAGQHHGVGTPDYPRELHHHHDARCETPAARHEAARRDREQRAAEAYYDRVSLPESHEPAALREAIGIAMRVKVTRDIVEAAELADDDGAAFIAVITAAFAAAGFEVEE